MRISRRRLLVTSLLLAAGGGCSVLRSRGPLEHLDRRTGLTLRISRIPFVFGRDEPSIATRALDAVAIHAVEFNRSGRSDYAIALFTWTTIDRLGRPPPPKPDRWTLLLDDRRLVLAPGVEPRRAGISAWPLDPPAAGARLSIHAIELPVLAYWVGATRASLMPEAGGIAQEPYLLRTDARDALADWLGAD